jgi:hypothetical protein
MTPKVAAGHGEPDAAGRGALGLFGELAHAIALKAAVPAHNLRSTRMICVLVMRTPFDRPSGLSCRGEERSV